MFVNQCSSVKTGNTWDFQRGCGCVFCLLWSRGPTALALILWRPPLPQRAELLIKKPSAQTEPFHLELTPLTLFVLIYSCPISCPISILPKSYLDFFWSIWVSVIDVIWISLCQIWIISTDRMSLKQKFEYISGHLSGLFAIHSKQTYKTHPKQNQPCLCALRNSDKRLECDFYFIVLV